MLLGGAPRKHENVKVGGALSAATSSVREDRRSEFGSHIKKVFSKEVRLNRSASADSTSSFLLSALHSSKWWGLILLLPSAGIDSCMACECAPTPICERISKASVVFLGEVLDDGSGREPDPQGRIKVLFAVVEAFKGLRRSNKKMEALATPEDSCSTALVKDRRYLILARRQGEQLLLHNDCSSVINSREATEDLQYLRAWARNETPTVLRGGVRANLGDTPQSKEEIPWLAEVEIFARGSERTYLARTNATGKFELGDLQPGNYEINVRLPGYESTLPNYRVLLKKGLCTRLDIAMWPTNSLSGTVFDEKGQPAKNVRLELAPLTEGDLRSSKEVQTDSDGFYEFTRVPSGNYYLGVNLERGVNSRSPFATCFYPGVSLRDQALVVAIEGGQKLTPYDFKLGNPHSTRPIRVSVQWWDGRPVNNASVECRSDPGPNLTPKMDWMSRYTDDHGEVLFHALQEREYIVAVEQLCWLRSSRSVQERQEIHVLAGKNPANVKLIVSQSDDIHLQEAPINMSQFNN